MTWARWLEDGIDNRRVAWTELPWANVSTVFLGLDHNFSDHGEPLLFESMAFWQGEGGYEEVRYATWMEAEAGHRAMVQETSRARSVLDWLKRVAQNTWREMLGDIGKVFKPED